MSDATGALHRPDGDGLRAPLEAWLQDRFGQASLQLAGIEKIAGGLSNETYRLRLISSPETGQVPATLVLRIQPQQGLLADYDLSFQYRVTQALQGTAVPAPRPIWFEGDAHVLGRPFYVMTDVAGEVPGRLLDPARRDTPARQRAFVAALAAIHNLDWTQTALATLLRPPSGRPAVAAVEWVDSYLPPLGSEPDAELFHRARARLLAAAPPPPSRLSLLHVDCSLSNYIFQRDRVVAVLDWELATLGDLQADVGYYCALLFRYRSGPVAAKLEERAAVVTSRPVYRGVATHDFRDRLADLLGQGL